MAIQASCSGFGCENRRRGCDAWGFTVLGMATLTLDREPKAAHVKTDEVHVTIYFVDGLTLGVTLAWEPRVLQSEASWSITCTAPLYASHAESSP